MNDLKIMIFGDYSVFGGRNIIIDIIDHEPTMNDKINFIKKIKKEYGEENLFYGVNEDNMKLEKVKVTDYTNRIINMRSLSSAYFSAIEKEK